MNVKSVTLGVVFSIAAFTVAAQAGENDAYVPGNYAGNYYPGNYGYGYGYGYHASTSAGDYLTGAADSIGAAGSYNLNTAMAAKYLQEARSLAIDNKVKAVHAYFELKDRNRQYVESKRRPPLSEAALARISAASLPQRPDASQLDAIGGEIYWPVAMDDVATAAARERLQELFASRARSGSLSRGENREVNVLALQIRDSLKARISTMTPMDYLEAKKFMASLAHEVQFAPTIQGVAAR